MSKYSEIADKFKMECAKYGFNYFVRNNILTISKAFQQGDLDAFADCDMNGPYLIDLVPSTSVGSVWGTDGGSVGGYSAVKNGWYTLNKSGCSKRVLNHLSQKS